MSREKVLDTLIKDVKLSVTCVQSITRAVQGDPLQQAQAPNGSKLAIPFGQMSETEKFLYKNSWSM